MTTTNRPELRPVLDRFQNPKKADAGATYQGDPIPMKECAKCLGKVVWVKSTKTGKFYLADCFRYSGDGDDWFYIKASPHFKSCETRVEENTRTLAEDQDRRDRDRRWDAAEPEICELYARWQDQYGDTPTNGYISDPKYHAEYIKILHRHGLDNPRR